MNLFYDDLVIMSIATIIYDFIITFKLFVVEDSNLIRQLIIGLNFIVIEN